MSTLTVSANPLPASPTARPRILTGPMVRLLVADFGAMTSFYLMLSVVPLYATAQGVGGFGAGLSTGVLMFASVAAELATPRLAARFGYRRLLIAGLVLLGAPALALPGASSMAMIMLVCVLRGLGFAIVVVAVGALVAAMVPAERRGEGLGLIGVVAMLPAVLALPLGVWLVSNAGFPLAFVVGALASIAVVAAVAGIPDPPPQAEEPLGVLAGLRSPSLVRPSIVFAGTAMAGGVVVTFLPAAVTTGSGDVAVLALFAQAAAATLTRWWAGRYADRHGAPGLLAPGVLLAAAGMLCVVLTGSAVAVLVGMVLFGAGFGIAQSASLTLMFSRVPASGYSTVSAVWNIAYDLGWGAGAAGIGIVVVHHGYPVAFALTAVLMLTLIPLARSHRSSRKTP